MAPHSSTLAWKIPWAGEPGGLQSMGSRIVRHDWATSLSLFTFTHWRRKWQPTPVFLSGESQGRGSLVGCRLWGRTESDTTEAMQQQQQQTCLCGGSTCVFVYYDQMVNMYKINVFLAEYVSVSVFASSHAWLFFFFASQINDDKMLLRQLLVWCLPPLFSFEFQKASTQKVFHLLPGSVPSVKISGLQVDGDTWVTDLLSGKEWFSLGTSFNKEHILTAEWMLKELADGFYNYLMISL